jgi:hypothetical protein
LQTVNLTCETTKAPLTAITTTSLAISFSSPNLATNSSFSSSSESDYHESATGGKSVITIQNLLDDNRSLDDNNDGDESLNLVGENDVEYAELTQRMIFPNQSTSANHHHHHQLLENGSEESATDLMLMNLFDGAVAHSDQNSSSHNHHLTAPRPIITTTTTSSSVLEKMNETAFHHPSHNGANSLTSFMPSLDVNQEGVTSSSLPHELLSTSPVWKTQVISNFFYLITLSFSIILFAAHFKFIFNLSFYFHFLIGRSN